MYEIIGRVAQGVLAVFMVFVSGLFIHITMP
jgi:hypothetical protein